MKTNNYQVSLNATTGATLSYDQNGNMTSDGTNSYAYDAETRLIKITYPGSSNYTVMAYDGYADLAEIVETRSGSTTSTLQFVYDSGIKAESRNSSGTIVSQFFQYGEMISSAANYFTKDHLGSIREMTNGSQAIQAQYSFTSFGQVIQLQGNSAADFQFAGYYFHAPSGLCFTTNRQYDPSLARWLTRDPLDDAEASQGPNLYLYVNNRPVIAIDPLGLAYFAIRPIGHGHYIPFVSRNPILRHFNKEYDHEQLFFEDGKPPPNLGYFGDVGVAPDADTSSYHRISGHYSDCIMREAVKRVDQEPGWTIDAYRDFTHNCQSWIHAVKRAYKDAQNDPEVKKKCCEANKKGD